MKTKFLKNEHVRFVLLLVLTALVLYYTPAVKPLFFLVIFYFFLKSKYNYFWLAYFFTIIIDIGGFYRSLTDNILPISVDTSLLFFYSLVSFIKVKKDKIKGKFFLKKNIDIWIFYMFFLLYIGIFVIGNRGGGKSGLRYFYFIFLMLPAILTLYTSYKLISNEDEFVKFTKLIFITVIINIIGQFTHLFLGAPVYTYFDEKDMLEEALNLNKKIFSEKLIRPVWGAFHSLIAIFLSLYWSIKKTTFFNEFYLMLILSLSIFSIFITATRGWIIALIIFILSALYLINVESKIRILRIIFIVLFSFFILYIFYEPVQIQTDQVFERLATLESLFEGDLTAGGTNSRLTDRNAPVMELFYKRPVFGSGFSLEGLETNDQHVGNQNILMSGGVVGYLVILMIWIHIIRTTLRVHKRNLKFESYKGEVLLMIPFLLALLVIHSSSTSLFDFVVYVKHPGKLLTLGVFFGVMNRVFYDNKSSD